MCDGRFILMALVVGLLAFVVGVPGAWAACDCTDAATTGVPQVECEALLALFNGTDGPNWRDNTNWDTDTMVDGWYGVFVSGGKVTGIILNGNHLE